MNSPEESYVENLINLIHLNEPAILYSIELRYWEGLIYTYTGPILLATNPFQQVKIYEQKTLETYYNYGLKVAKGEIDKNTTPPLPPHLFAIADNAYRQMMKCITSDRSTTSADQSILISGESGAGKTESTKILLRYVTSVSGREDVGSKASSTMDKVIQSNPILEAFGNARTNRNDNSSRFGKFVVLNFDKHGYLLGATLETYLLERVRVCAQQGGERNFHVFYQMLLGGSAEELKRWGFTSESVHSCHYVNQGKILTLQNINDKTEYKRTKDALVTLAFEKEHQLLAFDIAAALLHLGQVNFISDADGEGSLLSSDSAVKASLDKTSSLLGVDSASLARILMFRKTLVAGETIDSKLNASSAADARDSLAKTVYSRLFDWIAGVVNRSLQTINQSLIRADIGILDVFGFECFEQNSFEQLCINYTVRLNFNSRCSSCSILE